MRLRLAMTVSVLLLVVAGCGSGGPTGEQPQPSSSPVSTVAPTTTVATGRLRVTQHQTSCCYTEGQVSFLTVRDGSGVVVAHRQFEAISMIVPVFDLGLPAGTYEIESYQQPCEGNCGALDPPTDKCTTQVDLAAGAEVFLTAAFAPGAGCSIDRTDTPLASPVPDVFAFREPYTVCGIDFSLEIEGDNPGRERICFADANKAGTTAELSAYEAGATPGSPDFLVYRANADGSVEVFLPNLGRDTDGPWRRYTCSGLHPDTARGFVLDGCTEPVEITQ